MDIRMLEEAAFVRIREQTQEEAEKFMARIRTNLLDLLCHSDRARAELPIGLDLSGYGGREAVERAIGKAVVNLLSLAAVFGVKPCNTVLRELGLVTETDTLIEAPDERAPADNGPLFNALENADAVHEDGKASAEGEHLEHVPDAEIADEKGSDKAGYRQKLGKAGSVEERTAIWKKIQFDRELDSKTKAELYQHMSDLNRKEAA